MTSKSVAREKSVEGSIRTLLKAAGAKVIKYHVARFGSIVGTPDLLVCYKGFFIAIEVKRPGENSTLIQLEQQRQWRKAGALVFVARGVLDIERYLFAVIDPLVLEQHVRAGLSGEGLTIL